MNILGDDVYIQRGENWSLDFDITNADGEPFMMLKEWENPFLAITVTAARYSQEGDYRHTWWLDLTQRYVENEDGNLVLEPLKRFTSTEALYLDADDFSVSEVMATYGANGNPGGRIVTDPEDDFDVTNFLFYVDPNHDGNRIYKYCKSYEFKDSEFDYVRLTTTKIVSSDYVFTIDDLGKLIGMRGGSILSGTVMIYYIYSYNPLTGASKVSVTSTKDPVIGQASFDISDTEPVTSPLYSGCVWVDITDSDSPLLKVRVYSSGTDYLAMSTTHKYYYTNDSIVNEVWEEYSLRVIKAFDTKEWVEQGYLYDIKVLAGELVEEAIYNYLLSEGKESPELPWSDEEVQAQIERIDDEEMRLYYQNIFDIGMPLMPTYDTKLLVLKPTKIYVSSNIQKGI